MLTPILLPIIKGRCTGLVDDNGNMLHDGDRVFSFNIIGNDEDYEAIRTGQAVKQGVPCTVRMVNWSTREGSRFGWVVVSDSGGCTGLGMPNAHRAILTELIV